jgi:ABC-type sugar transport system substrate-binding protein
VSALADARREGGAAAVRALLLATFAAAPTAAAACDALGLSRTTDARGYARARTATLRRAAKSVGVEWPYTRPGRPWGGSSKGGE